jgi:hypothetical protein
MARPLSAESTDVHGNDLKTHDVVWNGFSAISNCHGDAVGISPGAEYTPIRLSYFATPSDGVLVWAMSGSRGDGDCDFKPGFSMAGWAAKRWAQLESRA